MRENEANLSQICFRSGAMEIFFVASLKVHFDKFATLLRFHFPARPVSPFTSWALSAMGPAYDSLIVRNKIKKSNNTTAPRTVTLGVWGPDDGCAGWQPRPLLCGASIK